MPQGGQNFGRGYFRPGPDIQGRVEISGRFVPARDAKESALIGSVFFIDTPAGATLARRVARIDEANRNSGALRFVFDKTSQLSERPITQSCSLAASGRNPVPNPCQFFQGQSATGAFSIRNERLCNAVVDVFLISRLLASKLFEAALRGLCVSPLQAIAPGLQAAALRFNAIARISFPVAVYRETDYAEINAKPIFGVELIGFRDVARRRQIPFPANETQIDLAFAKGEQAPLVFAHDNRDRHATFNRPEIDRAVILNEPNDSIVVWLGGILAKYRRNFSVYLERVRYLSNRPNGGLCSQAKALAHVSISGFLQVELPERFSDKSDLGQPRTSRVTPGKCSRQNNLLFSRWSHFEGRDELHNVKYRRNIMETQPLSCCARSAIPPRPEGRGFSRRNR